MDIKQLLTFITLAETLNYPRAAERLQYEKGGIRINVPEDWAGLFVTDEMGCFVAIVRIDDDLVACNHGSIDAQEFAGADVEQLRICHWTESRELYAHPAFGIPGIGHIHRDAQRLVAKDKTSAIDFKREFTTTFP